MGVLGETDVQSIKDDINEVKEAVKDLTKAFNDLRVLVAGDYVKKKEFDAYKKEETESRWKLATLTASISAIAFGVLQWVVGLVKGGGN